jgi:hypothetical protein
MKLTPEQIDQPKLIDKGETRQCAASLFECGPIDADRC